MTARSLEQNQGFKLRTILIVTALQNDSVWVGKVVL